MAMVVVDDSCLQADSQPKSGGLVWGSTAACALRCIHQMNRVTLAMTFSGHDDSTINIVLGLLLLLLSATQLQISHQHQPGDGSFGWRRWFTRFIWWMQHSAQAAVDPQTKPPDLGCESACRQLSSTTTIAIYYYYSAQKLILIYRPT